MATFITLGNYTPQGLAGFKHSPGRLDAAREQLAALGVQIKDAYLTMGEYDLVVVVEAPDNYTAAKALLALGMQGNVTTTTMAALNEDEFRQIAGEVG